MARLGLARRGVKMREAVLGRRNLWRQCLHHPPIAPEQPQDSQVERLDGGGHLCEQREARREIAGGGESLRQGGAGDDIEYHNGTE